MTRQSAPDTCTEGQLSLTPKRLGPTAFHLSHKGSEKTRTGIDSISIFLIMPDTPGNHRAGLNSKRIKKVSIYSKIYSDLFGLKNDFITFATSNSQQRNDEEL